MAETSKTWRPPIMSRLPLSHTARSALFRTVKGEGPPALLAAAFFLFSFFGFFGCLTDAADAPGRESA
eukprot:4345274-Pleurochrysis_carterae.AAC.1